MTDVEQCRFSGRGTPQVTARLARLRAALSGRKSVWGGCPLEPEVLRAAGTLSTGRCRSARGRARSGRRDVPEVGWCHPRCAGERWRVIHCASATRERSTVGVSHPLAGRCRPRHGRPGLHDPYRCRAAVHRGDEAAESSRPRPHSRSGSSRPGKVRSRADTSLIWRIEEWRFPPLCPAETQLPLLARPLRSRLSASFLAESSPRPWVWWSARSDRPP